MKKEKYKNINRLLRTVILSGFLVFLLAIGGTFAWISNNQHKTNEFVGDGIYYDIRLVEEFEEKEDWDVLDDPVPKIVRVRNAGNKKEFGEAYVRLQLKEYMEIDEPSRVFTDDFYKIDQKGELIRFESEKEAIRYINKLPIHYEIDKLKAYDDLEEAYYLREDNADQEQPLGRKILLDILPDKRMPLESIIDRNADLKRLEDDDLNSIETHHGIFPTAECELYPVHLWGKDRKRINKESVFSEYVKWNMGTDVMTLTEYKEYIKGKPKEDWAIDKWILDDSDDINGWAYWGNPLTPKKEYTSNLLESIELIKQPDGAFNYAIHIDMQSVSFEDLIKWPDLPSEIEEAWRG